MISRDCIITVNGNKATIDSDIYLYKYDKNIQLSFSIINSKYMYDNDDSNNLIKSMQAAYAQVKFKKHDSTDIEIEFPIQATNKGAVLLTITGELIDEDVELGDYTIQIRLLDANKNSVVTLPPVESCIHILAPLFEKLGANTNEVNKAVVNKAVARYAAPLSATTEDGTFNSKTWVDGDKITTAELNRMEKGIKTNSTQYKDIANKIGTFKSYDDTAIKNDINDIKSNIGTEVLTTTAEDLKGAINELNTQYKDIANKLNSGNTGSTIEPLDDDLPNVYITGTLPTSKEQGDLPITIHYVSKTLDFKNYGTLKVQGASSASYPKKNFTLKLYEDETLTTKIKRVFKNWGKLNKFVLKAHWIDCSHIRNVGTAKIWGKIAKSRSDYDTLPEEFKKAPNAGATDGFTVRVFANGIYQGLYEWIVPKDKLFGQDSANPNHSIATTELNNQPSCAFATTTPTLANNWSEELQDTMSTATSNSLTNFIKFVAGSSDADFIANAENYFDVQSVIDYDIFARIFCIVDNLCRNQIFFTYDGTKWYEGVWDLDAVLGLPPTTRGFYAYNTEFQNGYIAYADYQVTNMLYQRVETLFMARFKARYNELRANILSIEGILDVYEKLTNVIKTYDGLLEEDYASTTGEGKFTGIPYQKENNIQQIRTFISKRLVYMDDVINKMAQPVPCTAISLNKTELTFTGVSIPDEVIDITKNTSNGSINRGSWSAGQHYVFGDIRTSDADTSTDFIPFTSNNTLTVTQPSTKYGSGVVAYDSDKKAIFCYTVNNTWENGNTTTGVEIKDTSFNVKNPPENTAYIRLCFNLTDLSNVVVTKKYSSGSAQEKLIATLTPTDTTDEVIWSVSPTGICTVNNGIVTPIKNGNCTITATCGTQSATCNVTISGLNESSSKDYIKDELFADYDLRQLQPSDTTVTDLTGNNTPFSIESGQIRKDDKNGVIFNNFTLVDIRNYSFNPNTNIATLEYMMQYTGDSNITEISKSFPNRTTGICGDNGDGFYIWLSGYGYCIFKNTKKIAEAELTEKLIKNNYYHVVVTYSTTEAKLYINGKLINTHLFDSTIDGDAKGNACIYFIGTTSGDGVLRTEVLYSARLYTKVLTAEEITNNYNYELAKLNINTL